MNANVRNLPVHRTAGFSLVELMITMTISLFLLAGIATILANSKQTYLNTDVRSRMNENARYTAWRLTTDVRHAGYRGCRHDDPLVDPDDLTTYNALQGVDGGGTNSDRLLVTYRKPANARVLELVGDEATVSRPHALRVNDAVALQSCAGGWEELQVASIVVGTDGDTVTFSTTPTIATADSIHLLAHEDALVETSALASAGNTPGATDLDDDRDNDTLVSNLWFVRNGLLMLQRDATAADLAAPNAALAEAVVGVASDSGDINVEERVENLQLLFGVDTNAVGPDGEADGYVTADAVTDWSRVVTVKLALLFASAVGPSLPADQRSYELLDVTLDPPDEQRHRKVVTLTVQGRNLLSSF